MTDADALRGATAATRTVHVADAITEYILDIADATRGHDGVSLGASPARRSACCAWPRRRR